MTTDEEAAAEKESKDFVGIAAVWLAVLIVSSVAAGNGSAAARIFAVALVGGVPLAAAIWNHRRPLADRVARQRAAGSHAEAKAAASAARQAVPASVRCPTCRGNDIVRVTGAEKVAGVALVGIAATALVGKTFRCRGCRFAW